MIGLEYYRKNFDTNITEEEFEYLILNDKIYISGNSVCRHLSHPDYNEVILGGFSTEYFMQIKRNIEIKNLLKEND